MPNDLDCNKKGTGKARPLELMPVKVWRKSGSQTPDFSPPADRPRALRAFSPRLFSIFDLARAIWPTS
jgi:hypothetical protein